MTIISADVILLGVFTPGPPILYGVKTPGKQSVSNRFFKIIFAF